jgi:H+/Cl- antiporter ClcA
MKESVRATLLERTKKERLYLWTLIKWLICALVVGGVCGLVGAAFHHCIDIATTLRGSHGWLLYLLPVAGVAIVALYHICGVQHDEGTNLVLNSIRSENDIPLNMTPLIFVSTVLTHLCGGSAGREGAALQIGGSIGTFLGRVFRLDEKDLHIITMAGMSALFAALFGTPVTAAVFSMEVVSVGVVYYAAFLPCIVSATTAVLIAWALGVTPTAFALASFPTLSIGVLWRVALLAAACALVSIVFITCLHSAGHLYQRFLKNPYLRIVVGGLLIIGLTLLLGTRDYNGAGMDSIVRAIEGGSAVWYAFLLKIVFTALTIGAGFKGGEIVPTFFVGATFGCAFGGLLGLDPGFAAAIGLVALFCGMVNCPLAALVLSIELFGSGSLLLFALACAVSYLLSGYYSLYSGQRVVYSKLRAEYVNRATH